MAKDKPSTANLPNRLNTTWLTRQDLNVVVEQVGAPVFIYHEERLAKNVTRIMDAGTAAGLRDRVQLYIPFFPNSNPHVLKPLLDLNVGLLLQIPAEYEIATRFGFDKLIISPGHISNDEIRSWADTSHPLFLSSLEEIAYLLSVAPNASVNVRIDSLNSAKPGIKYNQLKDLSSLLQRHGRNLDCYEVYCGSGNSVEQMIGIVEQVFMIFKTYFNSVSSINFAGGYGFAYERWVEPEKHFDWTSYFEQLRATAERYGIPDHVKFLFEPARDVLADAGVHLLSVQRPMIRNASHDQVLTNGSRVLMPSAQYKNRQHNVIFLDHGMNEMTSNARPAMLRGRGILRNDYVLPGKYMVPEDIGPGDYVLILDTGAYCATQHMEFLGIPPAAEVSIGTDGKYYLISAPGEKLDKWRLLLDDKKELSAISSIRAAE